MITENQNLQRFNAETIPSGSAFIGRFTFEPRSQVAYQIIDDLPIYSYIFSNSLTCIENTEVFFDKRASKIKKISVNAVAYLNFFQEARNLITELSQRKYQSIYIDISCFRREELLILFKIIYQTELRKISPIFVIYTPARDLGPWLSKSVSEIRSVIGMAGEIYLNKPTHLILLCGIENYRAMSIINQYEPQSISLGMVPESGSVSDSVFQRNLDLRDYIRRHFDSVTREFDFLPYSVEDIHTNLSNCISAYSDHNIVMSPLNSKISTLISGCFAFLNPEIQLCYSAVKEYNIEDYSSGYLDPVVMSFNDFFLSAA